jgi:hypothetical protein
LVGLGDGVDGVDDVGVELDGGRGLDVEAACVTVGDASSVEGSAADDVRVGVRGAAVAGVLEVRVGAGRTELCRGATLACSVVVAGATDRRCVGRMAGALGAAKLTGAYSARAAGRTSETGRCGERCG